MEAGITPAGQGLEGTVWRILGQTYVPKQHSEACFTFEIPTRTSSSTFCPVSSS